MKKKEINFDLAEPITQELSPYDVSYPVSLLSNGIKRELQMAQVAAENIYRAVIKEMPVLTQVKQAMDKGCRYVVDASESTIKAIESGALKLSHENGKTYAQLMQNGKYSTKLPIKKEVFRKGIDPIFFLRIKPFRRQVNQNRLHLPKRKCGSRSHKPRILLF